MIFVAAQTMYNAQFLIHTNWCNKYAYKYIVNIDKDVTDIHKKDTLVSQSIFMHNTNISSLKKLIRHYHE